MTMTDDQVIREALGRMADEAPPPLTFAELGVHSAKPPGPDRMRRFVLLGSAAAVAVLVVATVLSTQPPDGSPPVMPSADATIAEFDTALTAALLVLDNAPGIEGVEESFIRDHRASRVWFSTRENGDSAVVQQTDVDVRDTAWWVTSSSPPAVGENVEITARVAIGSIYYTASTSARGSEPWTQRETGPPGIPAFGLAFFDDDLGPELREQLTNPDTIVVRQSTANGGETWTLTSTIEDRNVEHRFHIHADGYLASWSWEAPGNSPDPTDPTIPIDAGNLSYAPLEESEPIDSPEIGTELDLTVFDLPDGFLIGPLADPLNHPLMSGAVEIGEEEIYTEALAQVIGMRAGDRLYELPVEGRSLVALIRPAQTPHFYATSCDVLATVELPPAWNGTCLERTIDGQRIEGVFDYGSLSD